MEEFFTLAEFVLLSWEIDSFWMGLGRWSESVFVVSILHLLDPSEPTW